MARDGIMKAYGSDQFEMVVSPARGVWAADEAMILRDLTRSAARAGGGSDLHLDPGSRLRRQRRSYLHAL